jgi:hypothetical protein
MCNKKIKNIDIFGHKVYLNSDAFSESDEHTTQLGGYFTIFLYLMIIYLFGSNVNKVNHNSYSNISNDV